jgi:hypothetical protein
LVVKKGSNIMRSTPTRLPLGNAGDLDFEFPGPLEDVGKIRRQVEVIVDHQNAAGHGN